MKTTIQYDRKERAYRVLDAETGEVLSQHPQGPEGRYQAERAVIASDAPHVLPLADNLAHQYPEAVSRAHKAALLVARGAVRPNGATDVYYVASETDLPTVYLVDLPKGTCGCEDFYQGRQGEPHGAPNVDGRLVCKHVLAASFFLSQRATENRKILWPDFGDGLD
ncbi:MAG: hypothetical protein IT330_17345 [Anaerolineae bacterium]|nr:hypothetical protein [Anaerolineae bacterium]